MRCIIVLRYIEEKNVKEKTNENRETNLIDGNERVVDGEFVAEISEQNGALILRFANGEKFCVSLEKM